MHPLTYLVTKAIPMLEFEQFRHVEDRERLTEVRQLALEQVADDLEARQDNTARQGHSSDTLVNAVRRGDTKVYTLSEEFEQDSIWPQRSEREQVLEAGLETLLDSALTIDQRVLVRLRYVGLESNNDIGRRLGVTSQAIDQRFRTIHKRLREAMVRAFGEADVASAQ